MVTVMMTCLRWGRELCEDHINALPTENADELVVEGTSFGILINFILGGKHNLHNSQDELWWKEDSRWKNT